MARILFGFGTRRTFAGGLLAAALLLAPARVHADPMGDGLVRIAEILGSAHHLRAVCGAHEGTLWRNKMIDLLDAAHATPLRRQIMISHFNDAYYRAQAKYPRCSETAAAEAEALFKEGQALAARLAGMARSATAF